MAGSKPGERRGGRVKGTPNKITTAITTAVAEKLAALGCDPIEGMARIALDPNADIGLRAKMFTELAGYVAAKRKPVDDKGSSDDKTIVEIVRFSVKDQATQ